MAAPFNAPAVLVALTLLLASSVNAQRSWFPESARQGASRALSERLKEADVVPEGQSDVQVMEKALGFVDATLEKVEALGEDGLSTGAPRFQRFELPNFGDATLQMLASYSVCTLPLHLELAETDEERFYVAVGEIAVVVVSAFLRDVYLRSGGTDAGLRQALDSEVMRKLSYDIQVESDLRDHAGEQCAEPMGRILN